MITGLEIVTGMMGKAAIGVAMTESAAPEAAAAAAALLFFLPEAAAEAAAAGADTIGVAAIMGVIMTGDTIGIGIGMTAGLTNVGLPDADDAAAEAA